MTVGDKALYLDGVKVQRDDIESAFRWLGAWEAAVPLRPYATLAQDYGTPEERAVTEQVALDLRQPVYDYRALFIRRCSRTDELLTAWADEKAQCECDGFCPLPFLRAVWRVRPLILALPAGWIQEAA